MIYTAVACLAIAASASSSYSDTYSYTSSSSSSNVDRNPDVGYQSGEVALGDGESGSVYWDGLDTYLEAALSVPDCTTNEDYVGVAVHLNFAAGGGATAWVDTAPSAAPVEDGLLFGGEVFDDITSIADTTQFYKLNRCDFSAVHLNLEGICDAATACVSTSDLRAHMTLFTGPQSSLTLFPDLAIANRDPSNDYVNGVTEDEFMEWMLYPVTHLWPDNHPEIQTVDNNFFWLEDGPQGLDMFGISQWVTWDSALGEAGSNIGLYTDIQSDVVNEFLVTFGLCFNFEQDPISILGGLQFVNNQSDYAELCPGGCWPQEDCTEAMDADTGSVEAVNYIQANAPSDATGVYVTTFVIDTTTDVTGVDHSFCSAWGSQCSPASSALPTFLGGALALLAMIM
jgi:hypothetical protein